MPKLQRSEKQNPPELLLHISAWDDNQFFVDFLVMEFGLISLFCFFNGNWQGSHGAQSISNSATMSAPFPWD